jgi:hypothetical protein
VTLFILKNEIGEVGYKKGKILKKSDYNNMINT